MDELCDDEDVHIYVNIDLKYVNDWDYVSQQALIERQIQISPLIESKFDGIPKEI
jgi:hypothetical protein